MTMLENFPEYMVDATLSRKAAGTYNSSGVWVPGAVTTSTIKIIFPQPATMEDVKNLEDGERVTDFVTTWSQTRLAGRRGNEDSDLVTTGGETFKVVQVNDRTFSGAFVRVVMRRV